MAVIVRIAAASSDGDSSGAPVVSGPCLGALVVGGPLVREGEDAVAAAGVQAQGAPAHDVVSSRFSDSRVDEEYDLLPTCLWSS